MTATVDDVIAWDLTGLPSAAASLTTLADRLIDARRNATRSASSDPEWRGVTHDAAQTRITAVGMSLVRSARTVDDGAESMRTAYPKLADLQSSLRATVDGLRADGYTVTGDGVVTHPDPDHRARALDATDRVQLALTSAVDLDASTAAALSADTARLTGTDAGSVVMPSGRVVDPRQAAQLLTEITDMDERRRVWQTLSQSERDEMLRDASSVIGNLDGIPFADRIVANELTLRSALRRAEDRRWLDPDRADMLSSLAKGGRTFLSFDEDSGRFVELVGALTPDVTNVAVFVPGTGTGLDDADSLRKKALNLSRKSGAPVIVWADGTFPQTIIDDPRRAPVDSMALSPELAAQNAPLLAAFARELDVEIADSSPGAQTTVIGHSYGGSIVGTAEQLGLRADRVVYASAAGTGVIDGKPWSNPEPDVRRYSLTPPGDPIHWAQRMGAPVHGGDPDVAPGVTRLDSGFLSPDESGARALLQGTSSHTSYLDDPGSDAFTAIADVVAGRTPEPYVHRADDLPRVVEHPREVVLEAVETIEDAVVAVDGYLDGLGGILRSVG